MPCPRATITSSPQQENKRKQQQKRRNGRKTNSSSNQPITGLFDQRARTKGKRENWSRYNNGARRTTYDDDAHAGHLFMRERGTLPRDCRGNFRRALKHNKNETRNNQNRRQATKKEKRDPRLFPYPRPPSSREKEKKTGSRNGSSRRYACQLTP